MSNTTSERLIATYEAQHNDADKMRMMFVLLSTVYTAVDSLKASQSQSNAAYTTYANWRVAALRPTPAAAGLAPQLGSPRLY